MTQLFELLQQKTIERRNDGYPCENFPIIKEILQYNKDGNGNLKYLRQAQFESLEVYRYLRLVLKTPKILDLYKLLFSDKSELLTALGINVPKNVLEFINIDDYLNKVKSDTDFVKKNGLEGLHESLCLDYSSYILALTMGAGKTVLIGTIIATEFTMSMEYPADNFMKNSLVFAPGTTIIESLREISDMAFDKILPPRFYKKFLANIKLIYPRNGEKNIQAQMGSLYNIIITNTEKINLKKPNKSKKESIFEFELKELQSELMANQRLNTIASLPHLGIFSDEAHHTYGDNLGEDLKRMRETINHLNKETNIVCVVNTTGTPYYKKQILKDVVFWYSLHQGIKDNILKNVHNSIIAYDFKDQTQEDVIQEILKDFFKKYKDTKLFDGQKAKIAFYFKGEDHLQESKSFIEKSLIKIGQNPIIILKNTQTSTSKEIEEFNMLNNPDSQKRIILLIEKGKEGWNCPSLFATALIREVSGSNNFVLQASTRCLRQVNGNNQSATIYLDTKNQKILNKELEENFGTTLLDLNNQGVEQESKVLKIIKTEYPKLEIVKIIKKIVRKDKSKQKVSLQKPKKIEENSLLKAIFDIKFENGTMLLPSGETTKISIQSNMYDLYTATQLISTNYHLEYMDILKQLKSIYKNGQISKSHLQELFKQVENQIKDYVITEEKIIQALAIIKFQDEQGNDLFEKDKDGVYCHTIRYKKGNDNLHVDQKDFKGFNKLGLGFHYTPYNFDSEPEKDFFQKMLSKLNEKKDNIQDIYFTGGLTNIQMTDFYFQYKGIDGKYHNYFPDFVIVKKDGTFLIVEIKQEGGQNDEEVQAKAKAVQKLEGIQKDKFKYHVIYSDAPIPIGKFIEVDKWIK